MSPASSDARASWRRSRVCCKNIASSRSPGQGEPARRAATAALDHFPGGAWLVELAPLAGPELVVETIAKVLRAPEASELAPLAHLGSFLAPRRLLLVLDNCEHLLDECARVATYLLTNCPSLVVLATSREPQGIGGEWALRVPPLDLPDLTAPFDVGRLLDHDGIRLFVERVRAAEPSFRLTGWSRGESFCFSYWATGWSVHREKCQV